MSKGVLQFFAAPCGPDFSGTMFLELRRTLARKGVSFHSIPDFASKMRSSKSSSASLSLFSSESDPSYSDSESRSLS